MDTSLLKSVLSSATSIAKETKSTDKDVKSVLTSALPFMMAGKKPRQKASGGNMQQQLKQLQAMQAEMEKAQEELKEKEITTTAGGGAVEVTINGQKEITKLTIDKDVVDPDDVEMLQDLVTAAVNEAIRQIEELAENEMNKITGPLSGMGIPGL